MGKMAFVPFSKMKTGLKMDERLRRNIAKVQEESKLRLFAKVSYSVNWNFVTNAIIKHSVRFR